MSKVYPNVLQKTAQMLSSLPKVSFRALACLAEAGAAPSVISKTEPMRFLTVKISQFCGHIRIPNKPQSSFMETIPCSVIPEK